MSERPTRPPPRNVRSLEDRLKNLVGDEGLRNRARRQLSYIAIVSALFEHAKDTEGKPIFLVKGGVAVELLFKQEARATKDLDTSVRVARDQMEPLLKDALARGWGEFAFRLTDLESIRETGALRGTVKVTYAGGDWGTVQIELAPTEGSGGDQVLWSNNTFIDPHALGLSAPRELPLVTLGYLIAQKLHACTDHSDPDRPNDRFRDLPDLLLAGRLVEDDEWPAVRRVCVEIFELRDKHPWPPTITVLPEWRDGYARLARQMEFSPADVEEAARLVEQLVQRIDSATSPE